MKRLIHKRTLFFLPAMLLAFACVAQQPVWQSGKFTVYPDRIMQPPYTATAISSTELRSDYQSPANHSISPKIVFKFSINGKDNEMPSGMDHHFNDLSTSGSAETPVIVFGKQFTDSSAVPVNTFLASNTNLNHKTGYAQGIGGTQG